MKAAWLQSALHLFQCQRGIRHMVQSADHGGGIEDGRGKWQVVDIRGNKAVSR